MNENEQDRQLTTLFQSGLTLSPDRIAALYEEMTLELDEEDHSIAWATFAQVMINLQTLWTPIQYWVARPPLYATVPVA